MAISAVVSAVAAGSAATVTAGMVLAAVSEVGLAMTVVGAVTGSKKLMKAGQVLGIVGGVGALANSAINAMTAEAVREGAASSVVGKAAASAAADSAASAGADVVVTPLVSEAPVTSVALDGAGAAGASGTVNAGAGGLVGAADSAAQPGTAMLAQNADASTGLFDQVQAATGNTATMTTPSYPQLAGVDPTTTYASAADGSVGTVQTAAGSTGNVAGVSDISAGGKVVNPGMPGVQDLANGGKLQSSGSFMDKLTGYFTNDKTGPGAMKLIGGVLQGAGSAYSANKNYEINKAQLEMAQQRQAWANQIPTITYKGPSGGIIASKRG